MATLNANALNIVEFAKFANSPRVDAIAYALVKHNAIIADIPWHNSAALNVAGARWEDGLPANNWVKLNEGGPTVSGAPKKFMEQAYIMRNTIATDHLLERDPNAIGNPHVGRVEAYLRRRSYDFNNVFINNSHTSGNADAPVGLRARLDEAALYNVQSTNKINGNSTMTLAASADNFIAHQEKLDEMLDSVDSPEGDGVVIYCNAKYKNRFAALCKKYSGQGGFSQAQDQYGRSVYRYKNAILRDVGVAGDQSTQIIKSTEANTGADGASTYTSIYAVNYNPGNFEGWIASMQNKEVPQPDGVLRQTFLEMVLGLYPQTHRCFARMYGINLGS